MGALEGHKRIAPARASNTREDSEALWLANGFPSHMVYVPFKQLELFFCFVFFVLFCFLLSPRAGESTLGPLSSIPLYYRLLCEAWSFMNTVSPPLQPLSMWFFCVQ